MKRILGSLFLACGLLMSLSAVANDIPPVPWEDVPREVAALKIEVAQQKRDIEALKKMVDKCDSPEAARLSRDPFSLPVQSEPIATLPPATQSAPAPEVEYIQRRVCDGRGKCHFETIAVAKQPSVSTPSVYSTATSEECSSCGDSANVGMSGGCAGGNCGSSGGRGGPLKAIGRALFGGKNR